MIELVIKNYFHIMHWVLLSKQKAEIDTESSGVIADFIAKDVIV